MDATHDEGERDDRFYLVRKLETLRPKTKEPRSIRVLNAWIAHAENELGVNQGGRLTWLVASTIVAAKLQQVIDESGTSRFSLKGGTLLQHRLGLESRATKDLDGIVSGDIESFLKTLDDSLAEPWGVISFSRTDDEIIRVPSRIVKPRWFEMVLSVRGDTWRRIRVEISPDEGKAGSSQEIISAPRLAGFGLPTPDGIVGIAISYQVAQKVHAATGPHDPPRVRNERPRDVVDLVLIKKLIEDTGSPSLVSVADAIQDTFASRAKEANVLGITARTWPTRITAYPHWESDFNAAAKSANVDMSLENAVDEINLWLDDIDRIAVESTN